MKEEKSDGKMKRENYWGMYSFQCDCGASMAINGERLQGAIHSGHYFKCPNQFYSLCNKSYSAEQFKKNALFIAPIIPNGMM